VSPVEYTGGKPRFEPILQCFLSYTATRLVFTGNTWFGIWPTTRCSVDWSKCPYVMFIIIKWSIEWYIFT